MMTPARYTDTPFPAYRYLPFQAGMPHPRLDPQGHSYGKEEEFIGPFCAEQWRDCQPYLYGVDLFNAGYWWEAHEAWEALWLAAGPDTPTGRFVQGLILLAAAQLKRYLGEARGAEVLSASAVEKLAPVSAIYLGVDAAALLASAERCRQENRTEYPQIRLQF